MQRTSTSPRPLSPFFNAQGNEPGEGGQIDWSRVSEDFFLSGKFNVTLNGAAAKNATSLTVDALTHPIKKGTFLDFGTSESVTVTLTAGKAIGQTSLAVTALSAAIPSGTILDFGVGKQAKTTSNAAAAAVTIPVEALDTALDNGDVATYHGGTNEAEVTADVAAGLTTIPVAKLTFALADNATAVADSTGTGDGRLLPQGLHISRTSEGKIIPRRDYSAGQGDVKTPEVLASDAVENSKSAAKSGYGTFRSGGIYENLMPDSDTDGNLPSAYKTELEAGKFWFTDWSDDRVS